MMDKILAEQITGQEKPRSFLLDISAVEHEDETTLLRETARDSVEFVFPDGFAEVDLLDECRALTQLNDFDTMYDLTMQYLNGKPVTINLKDEKGGKTEFCSFFVTHPQQDLRGVQEINDYPFLVVWMTEFIGGMLSKKFPVPGKNTSPQSRTPEQKPQRMKEPK
jgi:hypothetical protein